MAKVTGIGGVFFKSRNPDKLKSWYEEHLGIEPDKDGYVSFFWRERHRPDDVGFTVWGPFAEDTKYFDPSDKPYMVNLRVDDLDAILEHLRDVGVAVHDRVDEEEYGRFGWFVDPEGTKIELWEPPPGWHPPDDDGPTH